MIDALAIGAPAWVIPALIIGSLLLLELFVAYFRLPQARQLRLACFALKSVAVVLMVGCLIEPLWQTARPQPHENIAAILVDNSRSMRINNPGEQVRRQQELLETLRDDTRWRERLAQNFDVRNYAFDTRLQRVKDYQSLEFEGNSSSLRTVLSTLSGRYHGQPLAGLILFSDGNATDNQIVIEPDDKDELELVVYRLETRRPGGAAGAPVPAPGLFRRSGRYGRPQAHERGPVVCSPAGADSG